MTKQFKFGDLVIVDNRSPTALVEKHLDSLRDAIDAAMKLHKVKDENNAKI